MKLVVGLGNPGPRYVRTRHNVGFRVVEALAAHVGLGWDDSPYKGRLSRGRVRVPPAESGRAPVDLELSLLAPTTFMNHSGESVRAAAEALAIAPMEDVVVVFDDLDLPLGRLRLRAAGGCGGHRGMESIAAELGSDAFARLRFGIGRPPAGEEVVDYVLSAFPSEDEPALCNSIERAVDALLVALSEGLPRAMERFNRAPEARPREPDDS